MVEMSYRKGALVVLTIINMIIGLAYIWLAIFDASAGSISRYSFILPLILSLAGLYAIVMSLHGLLATVVDSRKQLFANSAMLGISVVVNLIILALLLYGRLTVGNHISAFWYDAYKHRVYIIRNIEEEFSCCGLRDLKDHAFPDRGNVTCSVSPFFGYDVPCFWLLRESVANEMDIALGWVIASTLIQLVTLSLTVSMYRAIVDSERVPLLSAQDN